MRPAIITISTTNMNQPGLLRFMYILPLDLKDHLFDYWKHGVDMSLFSFCNKLHYRRSKVFNHGIASIQHWLAKVRSAIVVIISTHIQEWPYQQV